MIEYLKVLNKWVRCAVGVLTCHRALYLGLSGCHGMGCWITGKPELYGPMALLYGVMAWKG